MRLALDFFAGPIRTLLQSDPGEDFFRCHATSHAKTYIYTVIFCTSIHFIFAGRPRKKVCPVAGPANMPCHYII